MSAQPSQRPRRRSAPKPWALAEDFDYVESDYEEGMEEEEEEEEEDEQDVDQSSHDDDEYHAAADEPSDDTEDEEEELVDEDDHAQEEDEEGINEEAEEEEASHIGVESETEEEGQGLYSTASVYHPTSKYEEPVYSDMARRYPSWPMLTLYDIHRRPRRVPSGRWHCSSSMPQVLHAFRCVICWSTLNKPKAVRECMHRFCEDCIEKSLRMGRNECPFCRVFVPSKRNLAVDSSVEILIENVLGHELRNLEHEELHEDDNASHHSNENDGDDDDYDADHMSPRLRRATRRGKTPVYTERPLKKRKTAEATDALDGKEQDKEDEDDEDEDDEEDNANPPALFDFYVRPHRDERHLSSLEFPYIRISGDATVATIVKFIQAKLSCDRPILITPTTSGRRLHEQTPLYMVGSVTKTLHYRLPPRGQPRLSTSAKVMKRSAVAPST